MVSAAKFGAVRNGSRSAPPCRWLPGLSDTPADGARSIWENLNDQAAIIIQIESANAVRNLDAILTAVGDQIDAVWIGTLDMRVSMGLDGITGTEPQFVDLQKIYEETLRKHNKANSGFCFGGDWEKGGNKAFVVVASDAIALLGEAATIQTARQNLPALSH